MNKTLDITDDRRIVQRMRRGPSAIFSAFTILGLCGVLLSAPMGDSYASSTSKGKLVFVPHQGQCYVNQECSALVATALHGTAPYVFLDDAFNPGSEPTDISVQPNGRLQGTADIVGTFSFGVCAFDNAGNEKCGTVKLRIIQSSKSTSTATPSTSPTATNSCTSSPNAPAITVAAATPSSGPTFTITASAVGSAPTKIYYGYDYFDSTSQTWDGWSSHISQSATLGTSLTYVSPQPVGKSRVAVDAYSENACGSSSIVYDNPKQTGEVLTAISTSMIVSITYVNQNQYGTLKLAYITGHIIDINGNTITVPPGRAGLLSFSVLDQTTNTVIATWTDLANESPTLPMYYFATDLVTSTTVPVRGVRVGFSSTVTGPTENVTVPIGHQLIATVTFAGIEGWSGSSGSIGFE